MSNIVLQLTPAEKEQLRMLIAGRPADQEAALRAYYGAPRLVMRGGYLTTDAQWAARNIKRVKLPGITDRKLTHPTGVDINRVIEFPLMLALRELRRLGLLGTIREWNGCWVVRTMRGNPNVWSRHTWAIAFDINASTNRMGTPGNQDPRLVQVLESLGFHWGGRWTGAYDDPMHWQWTDPVPGVPVMPWQDSAIR